MHVKPLDASSLTFFQDISITHILALDQVSVLLLSLPGRPGRHFAWKVELDTMNYDPLRDHWVWSIKGQWQAVIYQGTMYLLGGEYGSVIGIQLEL